MNKRKKVIYNIIKYPIIFIAGAIIYMAIEVMYRGFTHWSMGILGGLSLVLIGLIDEVSEKEIPLLVQAPIASMIITLLEYYTGCIVNIRLGWNIWDYSNLPWNVDGQVCLLFSLIWMVLGAVAVVIDNYMRYIFFDEPLKKTRLI